jgi:formate dehydrogenase iron-sulfur subunit
MKRGFIFDINKCVGCEACVVACQIENDEVQSELWRSVSTFNSFQHPALPLFSLSLACNHCEHPLCLTGCPANAFQIDPVYHTVDHNPDRCIGCRYCTWMCPYDAPKFAAVKGIIEKCTLCKDRIADGQLPNCANLCPTGALDYGEIENHTPIALPGFTEKGIWPAVKIIPLRRKTPPLHAAALLTSDNEGLFEEMTGRSKRKSTVKSEWPLIAFTLLAAFLVAAVAASSFGDPPLSFATFIVLAGAGMMVSTLHLGKPERAWRALLNVRSSWLSREIALFTLFIVLSGASMAMSLPQTFLIVSTLAGIAMLISIEMVYAVVEGGTLPSIKSGSVFMNALLFFAILAHMPILAAVSLVLDFGLYVREMLTLRRSGTRRFVSVSRIALGFVLPMVLLVSQESTWTLAFFVTAGEAINRVEFYLDLDIMSPKRQIQKDVHRELAMTATGG